MCTMRLDGIAAAKLADRAHLYVLFRLLAFADERHQPHMLYEVFVPAITGTTLRRACANSWSHPLARAEPLQQSGTCYYRCIIAAFRCLMARFLSDAHARQLHLALRRTYLAKVRSQLVGRPLYHSHRVLVQIAATEVARSAILESRGGRLGAAELHATSVLVQDVAALLACTPELGSLQWADLAHLCGYPWDYPARRTSNGALPLVAGLAICAATASADLLPYRGAAQPPRKHVTTDFLTVRSTPLQPSEYAGGRGVLAVLSAAVGVVQHVHSVEGASSSAGGTTRHHLQVAALIEQVMLEVLPIPDHPSDAVNNGITGTATACAWQASSVQTFDELRLALMELWQLYSGASSSIVVSRDGHTVAVLTHAAFMCALWQMATHVPTAAAAAAAATDELVKTRPHRHRTCARVPALVTIHQPQPPQSCFMDRPMLAVL